MRRGDVACYNWWNLIFHLCIFWFPAGFQFFVPNYFKLLLLSLSSLLFPLYAIDAMRFFFSELPVTVSLSFF